MRLRPKKRIAVAEPTRVLVRRPRFRRAVVTGCGAAVALIVGSSVVPVMRIRSAVGPSSTYPLSCSWCSSSPVPAPAPSELDALARWRGGQTAGSAMRMLVTGFGYAIALMGMFSMLSVPVGHLLLGGAIAGVVIGIAAQQSLGNVFAGLVLLMARPFAVGNHIRVRSGALGGEFYGTVTSMSLTYVSVLTDEGMLEGAQFVAAGRRRRAVGPLGSVPLRTARQQPDESRSWRPVPRPVLVRASRVSR